MNIIEVDIDKLKPYKANAKKHPPEQVAAIAKQIDAHGWDVPIVVDKDYCIIKGHGRLEAAKSLLMKKVPVIVRTDLTKAQAKAARLADNKIAESEWDLGLVKHDLTELYNMDFDLDLTGFGDFDLDLDKPELNEEKEDEVPEVNENEYNVKLGQIYQLGKHRIMCGDSTDKATVEKLMNGQKADMVFTDPPYGINLDTNYSQLSSDKSTFKRNVSDKKKVQNDDKDFNAGFLIDAFDCEMFLWGANYYTDTIPVNEGSWVVWDKRQTEALDRMYGSCFELCWSRKKHKQDIARVTWAGCLGHSKKDDGDLKVHPTQKPTKLAIWFFDRWGKDKTNIVDLFLGSGSTLIACEKTGRTCYGMELDPHYCSVIIKRWQEYTGQEAKLIESA